MEAAHTALIPVARDPMRSGRSINIPDPSPDPFGVNSKWDPLGGSGDSCANDPSVTDSAFPWLPEKIIR
jgi:hypothetical protein